MKIDLKNRNTRIVVIFLAIVLVPILFNQCKNTLIGLYSAYSMNQPKEVEIATPESREINPTIETTGRIEAKYSVDIIARVEGWLQKRYFEEGETVKKGQKLFLIQPEEYALAARNARATVSEARAVYKNAQINYDRASALLKEDLVSREYYDNALTTRNQSRAALDGANAQLSKANLNLSYTNITSPMNGRIGKVHITEGNYVTPSSGVITQIYSTNPMKVTFSLKSSDFIRLKRLYYDNKLSNNPISVLLKLADGETYEHEGRIEFVDNKIDKSTGTVSSIAIFENPKELLVPGDYVNIILKQNKPKKVMLIPQAATKTDVRAGYYVWVEENGQAVKKDVKVSSNIDNNWVVESGLNYSDKVIVSGIQDIYKSGQKVKVKKIRDKK